MTHKDTRHKNDTILDRLHLLRITSTIHIEVSCQIIHFKILLMQFLHLKILQAHKITNFILKKTHTKNPKPQMKIPNKTPLNVYMKIPIYVAFQFRSRCYVNSLKISLINAQKNKQSSLAIHSKDIQMKAIQT